MFNSEIKEINGESVAPDSVATSNQRRGYSPQLMQVSDIWQNFLRGALSKQALLQALSKRVAELPAPYLQSRFEMATLLAQWPHKSRQDVAGAIDALLGWADEYGITVIDGTET